MEEKRVLCPFKLDHLTKYLFTKASYEIEAMSPTSPTVVYFSKK
jgi:hypothetical protein